MTVEGNYTFAGVSEAEAQERYNEHRTGVPSHGDGQTLLVAPARDTVGVKVANSGPQDALLRLRHGTSVKTQTGERLAAFATGVGNRYVGRLARRSIVPGTIVISEAGALANIVDDGAGVLHDIGVPANVRGTVDYVLGLLDWAWGGAATEPVLVTYNHTDYTDFYSPQQTTTKTSAGGGSAGVSEIINTGFGRVVPFSVSITESGGAKTFADDGKGNIIQTDSGFGVVGVIDYATGVIDISQASANLAGTITVLYIFNPFATLLVKGGGHHGATLMPGDIPELASEPWADGIKGEEMLSLWGESRAQQQTHLTTQWFHQLRGHESYRVQEVFTAFPPGGESNDPRVTS